ncbi:MAG: peptide chain release factor N(5)-glutamine methyltransferase [Bacteroidota bacterium]
MQLKAIRTIYHTELDTLYGTEEVDHFFYLALGHYLGLERFILAVQPQYALAKREEQPLFETLAQLKQERPIQYILGKAHFMDLEFTVNSNVLIPRPETEDLVRWIFGEIGSTKYHTLTSDDKTNNSEFNILDIGTGSGCIAIALAKNLANATVYAFDISKKALATARKNAEDNKVQVEFLEVDILHFKRDIASLLNTRFDIIVSNPPYVREMEKKEIRKNVKAYEPSMALFVPDDDPLLFYKAIMKFSKQHLKSGGKLFFEINQYLAQETEQLLKDFGFTDIALRKDIFGNDRMLKARNQFENELM